MRPDYTDYLEKHFDKTEADWIAAPEIHDRQAEHVRHFILSHQQSMIGSVCEIGCGTGHLASRLPDGIIYLGIDSSSRAVEAAWARNPGKAFLCESIRAWGSVRPPHGRQLPPPFDLVLCFGFLKHFGLHEWDTIVKVVLEFGRFAIFDMPVSDDAHDDIADFHHVFVTEALLNAAVAASGFTISAIDKSAVEWVVYAERSP